MWKWLKEDLDALRSFDGIKIYYDKKHDIFMSEVRNKPNKYVPCVTRIYIDSEKELIESTNDEPTLMENFWERRKNLLRQKVMLVMIFSNEIIWFTFVQNYCRVCKP